jgi:hypothetical protein
MPEVSVHSRGQARVRQRRQNLQQRVRLEVRVLPQQRRRQGLENAHIIKYLF